MAESEDFRKAFGDDEESLAIFLRGMRDFDRAFCDKMFSGVDYNLKLEVHGNKGRLIHCRVYSDRFERPRGVEGGVERRGHDKSRDRA